MISIFNQKQVRRFIKDVVDERKGGRFTRISQEFVDAAEAEAKRQFIANILAHRSSKTLQDYIGR